ncbi:MAG TPA: hypothetical protein EYG94_05730 [Campylobacterales bacterium]|nr:hypothetical protein [Campylobacterales bacterium]
MENNQVEAASSTEIVHVNRNKKNKLVEAEALIMVSQDLVEKVDSDVAKCKIGISEAAEAFDSAKRTFNNVTFKNAENLLEKTGFEYTSYEESEAFELSIDVGDKQDFSVKKLSSGRFTGLILALLAALATAGGLIYLAMSKLNIDTSSIDAETATSHVNPVLNWMGGDIVSGNNNMIIGALILGFSALIVAWLVYALRISLKGAKNLRIAKDTFEKSNEYCMTQEECQKEMKKVDAHLREATTEIGNLETILNEQSSVLKRIIHVEGVYDDEKDYHPSSKKVMRETEKIMRASESLLETAITQDKRLNFQSVQSLNSARAMYAEYLSRIYD